MNKFTTLVALGAVKAQSGQDLLYAETRSPGTLEDRVFTMPLDPVGTDNADYDFEYFEVPSLDVNEAQPDSKR